MVLQLTVMMPYMDFNRMVCLLELPCTATQDTLSFGSFLFKPHLPIIHDVM